MTAHPVVVPALDPYSYDFHEDPYPTYAALREHAPLYRNDDLGFWALSRHADVVAAFRDADRFSDPFRFDVRRTPNPHVGYGAGGPHFCLGANLARREISVMFDELHRRLPDLCVTGAPAMLQSNFIHGIKRMPCAWTAP